MADGVLLFAFKRCATNLKMIPFLTHEGETVLASV